ncbi:MAG: M20/M25/M40 family metallo-hydrolase [Gaiellales bacterium]|nr:M20/M25/M40 family metallo-hydrolase [Gaiellales bacterium]
MPQAVQGPPYPEPQAESLARLFSDLACIPSPPGAERGVADFIVAALRGMGLEPEEDAAATATGGQAGNLYCLVPGTDRGGPHIVLSGHMDTVVPTDSIEPVLEEGVFRNARPTILGADDKSALAALLHATEILRSSGMAYPAYELLFTVSEETALTGIKQFNPARLRSGAGAVFDSSGPVGGVVLAAPTQTTVRAWFQGRAAHAGVEPEKGCNAILAAATAVSRMELGRLDEETTANVGLIQGGTARNIVAEQCFIECECRSHNEDKLARAVASMLDAIQYGATQVGADVRVASGPEYRCYRLSERGGVVRLACRALRDVGLKPELKVAGGGADSNILNAWGIPTVNLSTGMLDMHTPEERIALNDLILLTRVIMALVGRSSEITLRTRKAGKGA